MTLEEWASCGRIFFILKSLAIPGYFGKNAVGVDVNFEQTAFYNGDSAMIWDGSWFESGIPEDKHGVAERTGVIPFPYINEKYASDGFSISKYSDAENEASIKFLKFISGQDFYRGLQLANAEVLIPVIVKEPDPNTKPSPFSQKVRDSLSGSTNFRDDIQTYDPDSHMLDTVRNALQGLFIGKTPEEVGAEIVKRIEDYQ